MADSQQNAALAAALEYVAAGWALCPIPSGKKGPINKGWNHRECAITTGSRARALITANVGLCHVYSGTCVLDVDDEQVAAAWLRERGVELGELLNADTAVRISSGRTGRAKLLYRLPPGLASLPTKKPIQGLELRCGAQDGLTVQDVLPPSIHPDTGRPYVWEYGNELTGDWRDPPELPPELLAIWLDISNGVGVREANGSDYGVDPLMVEPPLGLSEDALWALLKPLDPDMPYDSEDLATGSWLRVGMAIHHETGGSDAGLALWDGWSMHGAKYEDGACLRHWASFRDREQAVTARWLRKLSGVVSAGADEALVLDPREPMGLARALRERRFDGPQGATLLRHGGGWYVHDGPCYHEVPEESMRCTVWNFLDRAKKLTKDGIAPFSPGPASVTGAVDALKAVVEQVSTAPACWLDGNGPAPSELVAVGNGLLHVSERRLLPHTPRYFCVNALPFSWNPSAPRPTAWYKFLADVWGDDPESIDCLQEVMGYLLTPDTSQQKIFLLLGPLRSGKGTIGRIMHALLGQDNVVGPTLSSLSGNFGLQQLIGKSVAIIPDARLSSRADQARVIESLLMVSGEDSVSADRKNMTAWTGRLAARFVIMTNELPRFMDQSGALARRFVILETKKSFYGHEDLSLERRLMAELPGILLWALEGRERLTARGYFLQPASGMDSMQELRDITSPVGAFLRDRCELGPDKQASCAELYEAWRGWCFEQGRKEAGTVVMFGRDLKAAIPGLGYRQVGARHTRSRHYVGVELRPEE